MIVSMTQRRIKAFGLVFRKLRQQRPVHGHRFPNRDIIDKR
jgi:hypothetical protein